MSNQNISFNCTLGNKIETPIRSTRKREVLTGASGKDAMLEGFAKGLQNLIKGEERWIVLLAEEASTETIRTFPSLYSI